MVIAGADNIPGRDQAQELTTFLEDIKLKTDLEIYEDGTIRAVWHRHAAKAVLAMAVAPPVFKDWRGWQWQWHHHFSRQG